MKTISAFDDGRDELETVMNVARINAELHLGLKKADLLLVRKFVVETVVRRYFIEQPQQSPRAWTRYVTLQTCTWLARSLLAASISKDELLRVQAELLAVTQPSPLLDQLMPLKLRLNSLNDLLLDLSVAIELRLEIAPGQLAFLRRVFAGERIETAGLPIGLSGPESRMLFLDLHLRLAQELNMMASSDPVCSYAQFVSSPRAARRTLGQLLQLARVARKLDA
jgi:hypothetical protein